MNVLIHMDLPKSCSDCRFYDDNYDYPTCIVTGYSRGYNWSPFNQRMPDCPLVAVPETHGRLIDVEILCEKIMTAWDIADIEKKQIVSAVIADIITRIVVSTPTIIPASKEDEL